MIKHFKANYYILEIQNRGGARLLVKVFKRHKFVKMFVFMYRQILLDYFYIKVWLYFFSEGSENSFAHYTIPEFEFGAILIEDGISIEKIVIT